MGKIHDKILAEKSRRYILPRALNIANSTVIQQLGLDTEFGMQRLLQLLLNKIDPNGEGVRLDLNDINNAVEQSMLHGRQYFLIRGENDALFMKMGTAKEAEEARMKEEALARAARK